MICNNEGSAGMPQPQITGDSPQERKERYHDVVHVDVRDDDEGGGGDGSEDDVVDVDDDDEDDDDDDDDDEDENY